MSVTSKRLRALPLAAALVAPLLLPVAADAAMGGANALTTALRPDLRTATVQSTNAVDDTTTVRVCFNKAIASLPQAGLFRMGHYQDTDVGDLVASSATRSTSNCADAVFPNDDATQFTYVSVFGSEGAAPDSGSSAVSTNGFGNIQDSTALIGSKTNNGTRGFTAGPDLVGVAFNNAAATIDYTYDQRIASVDTGSGAFSYNLPDGTEVDSIGGAANRALSADGLTVRVNFAPGPQIQDGVRAFSDEGAVDSKTGGIDSNLRSVARPGSGGFTDAPDLVSVTVAPNGAFVDYQFDQVLQAVPGPAADFDITGADGFSQNPAALPTIVGGAGVGNTVRAIIAGIVDEDEVQVQGAVDSGAVTGAVGGTNTEGGVPAGGNAGAFATGFTMAPEALTVSFDNATDVASVLFDQRWNIADENDFVLIDDQGSQIAGAAINVSGTGAINAGRTLAQVTFPAGTLAGARSLLIQNGGVQAIDVGAFDNVDQVISPTAPAARTARKFRSLKRVGRTQRAALKRR